MSVGVVAVAVGGKVGVVRRRWVDRRQRVGHGPAEQSVRLKKVSGIEFL